MGYETQLFVVQHYDFADHKKLKNGAVIASIDLCKVGYNSKLYKVLAEARAVAKESEIFWDVYMSGSRKGTLKKHDLYGEPLSEVDLTTVYDTMLQDNKVEEYRRYDVALALLKDFTISTKWSGDITLLQFGH